MDILSRKPIVMTWNEINVYSVQTLRTLNALFRKAYFILLIKTTTKNVKPDNDITQNGG